jgi:hypothetical protein
VDASVQRVLAEPVVAGPRGTSRHPERRKREGQGGAEGEPHFALDAHPAEHPSTHVEPHTPKGDGLGEKLDVIA